MNGLTGNRWLAPCLRAAACCALLASAAGSSMAGETFTGEAAVAVLEHIATGYDANRARTGDFHAKGREFFEQKGAEGHEIPQNKRIELGWRDFEYFEKDGKKRYQAQMPLRPNETSYVLDNNEKLVGYGGNSLVIYPLEKEQYTWNKLTGDYGHFNRIVQRKGYDNVALAMRSMIELLAAKLPDKEYPKITITEANGLYEVKTEFDAYRIVTSTIDAHKGYNVVAIEDVHTHPKLDFRHVKELEYVQDDMGEWVLKNAVHTGRHKNVIEVHKVEITLIEAGDLGLSDEIFEIESLPVHEEYYVDDHRYSPPLSFRHTVVADIDNADALLDIDLDLTEVAKVRRDGSVRVETHDAAVEHMEGDAERADETADGPGFTVGWWIALSIVLAVAAALVAVVRIRRRPKGGA